MAVTKEELQRQAREVGQRLERIEEAEREAENTPYAGRFFKYRNSYSCPEKPSDYWWMYAKCIRANGGGVTYLQFETDKYGHVSIVPEKTSFRHMRGYTEISKAEFKRAWDSMLKRVAKFKGAP